MKYKLNGILLMILCLSCLTELMAQVGIGTSTPRGKLEVSSSTSGLIIPNVALTSTSSASPVTNPQGDLLASGTLVWNTATNGSGTTAVTPGFYYWNGSSWQRLMNIDNSDWKLVGNSGSGTSILGTRDNVDLRIYTNLTERMFIGKSGGIGINTSGVEPTTSRVKIVGSGTVDGAVIQAGNIGATIGKEVDFSYGAGSTSVSGAGVYSASSTGSYIPGFFQTSGSATMPANVNYSTVAQANYNLTENESSSNNVPASFSKLVVSHVTLAGDQAAVHGYSDRGTTLGNSGYSIGVLGEVKSQNQDSYGVKGITYSNAHTAYGSNFGGFFNAKTYTGTDVGYAYVGGNQSGTQRKIVGTGTVSEIIPTATHGRITMTAPESPEYWYQDYGTVNMVNGKATIQLDPILSEIIMVDDQHPVRVFCTPEQMPWFNGVTVMSQNATMVELQELNGGTHSGRLQYQLVAKPKTNFGEGRFPQAPGPAVLKPDQEPSAAKTKNQPGDGRKIFRWPADHEVYGYDPNGLIYATEGDGKSPSNGSGKKVESPTKQQ